MYLGGGRLLEETETIDINLTDIETKALTKDAEAIVTVAHAIYKKNIYLLSDYYVTRRWLSRKALGLAEELKAEKAVETALRLNKQIEKGR